MDAVESRGVVAAEVRADPTAQGVLADSHDRGRFGYPKAPGPVTSVDETEVWRAMPLIPSESNNPPRRRDHLVHRFLKSAVHNGSMPLACDDGKHPSTQPARYHNQNRR